MLISMTYYTEVCKKEPKRQQINQWKMRLRNFIFRRIQNQSPSKNMSKYQAYKMAKKLNLINDRLPLINIFDFKFYAQINIVTLTEKHSAFKEQIFFDSYNHLAMLLDTQIQAFILESFKDEIIRQSTQNIRASINIYLSLDLTKIFRHHNDIGKFLVSNYVEFIKQSEKTATTILNQQNIEIPQYGINIHYFLKSCPLPRHNIQSSEFMSAAIENKQGVMIYIKNAQVLKTYQPELYLHSWVQSWLANCKCLNNQNPSKIKKRFKQSLLQIIKSSEYNLKGNSMTYQLPRCSECNSKYKILEKEQEVYLNCQKVKIYASMKGNDNKEQIFHQGVFQLYLDQININKLKEGQIMDMCCFFMSKPKQFRINSSFNHTITIKVQSKIFLICVYNYKSISSSNNKFFGTLRNLQYKYTPTPKGLLELQLILENYRNLVEIVNRIKFPYLTKNNFTTLKFCIINSICCHSSNIRMNLFLITEEIELIDQALQIPFLQIKKMPTIYDSQTIEKFFLSCHNAIVLIMNLSKKDLSYINNILDQKIFEHLNITIWVLNQPDQSIMKETHLDRFQVILDLSFQNNFNVCSAIYEQMIDKKLSSFILNYEPQEQIATIPRINRCRQKFTEDYYDHELQLHMSERFQQMKMDGKIAKQLLSKYFLKSRDYKKTTTKTLSSIKSIAEGFSLFRGYIGTKKNDIKTEIQINVIDALLAIFIDEQSSRHRYGTSNTLFANEISKLMLNEGNCEISFWDYKYGDDEIEEEKQYITKDTMFRRMVWKLDKLLNEDQLF